ncbi:MAG TPA: NTP transferase domain-containing protein [candidate division Zixibacteria bacterium]|jgi:bifunctional UDP-N-acetylglucosamine pyrophosphorylase/glucosamine-1-phosphate N-acetyltransferase
MPDQTNAPVAAVVLAAGLGKRMGVETPKVMLHWHGKPLVRWVVTALRGAGIGKIIMVIGHHGELVEREFFADPVEFVWQQERLGTAHAVRQAEGVLRLFRGHVLVALGDVPRLTGRTVASLIAAHLKEDAAATILTAEVPDPTGYGRVVRAEDGSVERIVEHRDADETTRAIREINAGLMCFRCEGLWQLLSRVEANNAQKEFYLTDAIGLLREEGRKVVAHRTANYLEVFGVNTPEELRSLE